MNLTDARRGQQARHVGRGDASPCEYPDAVGTARCQLLRPRLQFPEQVSASCSTVRLSRGKDPVHPLPVQHLGRAVTCDPRRRRARVEAGRTSRLCMGSAVRSNAL